MTALEARVAQLEELVEKLEGVVDDLRLQMPELKAKVEANAQMTLAVKKDTAAIVSLMEGFKVLGWLAKAAAAIAAVIIFLKTGGKP